MAKTILGIIGGSGVYDIPGLENARWERVKSPWGEPSDELLCGTFNNVDLVFLLTPQRPVSHRIDVEGRLHSEGVFPTEQLGYLIVQVEVSLGDNINDD